MVRSKVGDDIGDLLWLNNVHVVRALLHTASHFFGHPTSVRHRRLDKPR